jgi:hypothetical protein
MEFTFNGAAVDMAAAQRPRILEKNIVESERLTKANGGYCSSSQMAIQFERLGLKSQQNFA